MEITYRCKDITGGIFVSTCFGTPFNNFNLLKNLGNVNSAGYPYEFSRVISPNMPFSTKGHSITATAVFATF